MCCGDVGLGKLRRQYMDAFVEDIKLNPDGFKDTGLLLLAKSDKKHFLVESASGLSMAPI